jgi:hypothetical protein
LDAAATAKYTDDDECAPGSVTVLSPSTDVGVTATADTVAYDGTAEFTVTEYNDGNVALEPAYVEFVGDNGFSATLTTLNYGWTDDGGNDDAVLDPGETWTWTVPVANVTADLNVTATGHGLFTAGERVYDVTCTEATIDVNATDKFTDDDECAPASVTVEQRGATRTIGFWQTHTAYTTHVFDSHLGGSMDLGWTTLDDVGDVFGVLWATPAKTSTGVKRCTLNQAKIICSTQLVGAILNTGLDNGAGVPEYEDSGMNLIEAAQDALQGTDKDLIIHLAGLLDDYNNSYDDIMIEDADPPAGDPFWGNATPKDSKAAADYTKPDTLGPC